MTKSIKNICIITGSRADYDLLQPIIRGLSKIKKFKVKTIVTGSHFVKYQTSIDIIKKDRIKIFKKIKIPYKNDSNSTILKSISSGIEKFDKIFKNNKFDLLIVLGDRYEIFSAVISASFYRIPIAHLSGGEVTEGAIDESLRHSITKFSTFHFVSNPIYLRRIKQLGENPKNIFYVGSTSVENVHKEKLYSKKDLQKILNFNFKKENYLITFHPVTFQKDYGLKDFKIILDYFEKKKNKGIIFTIPNSDAKNFLISRMMKKFVEKNKNSRSFGSLGRIKYFSVINNVDAVIGNSSSGLSEVPSFKKPTINIGLRQKGRIRSKSIIDIENISSTKLSHSLKKIKSKTFLKLVSKSKNPYYKKNTTKNILKILRGLNLNKINQKNFFDIGKNF